MQERTSHKADEDTVLKMRDKEMKNLMNEYETLKKMSDYNYAIDLKAQLKESMDTVRMNNKLIKDLEAKQRRADDHRPYDPTSDIQKTIAFKQQKLVMM